MYKPSQVGKVDSTPFVQVTSLFPLKVNPVSQVTVYLLPEAIVAEVGDTVPSAIVGLLHVFADPKNTKLSTKLIPNPPD